MTTILFYVFGLASLAAAVLAVTRKNVVVSALWLVLMFFGLAANYVLLEAYFVAVVQVLVYAGAIMVLFLFVIMLMDLRKESLEDAPAPRVPVLGVIASGALLVLGMYALITAVGADDQRLVDAAQPNPPETGVVEPQHFAKATAGAELDGGAEAIGEQIFETWLLSFEVTSILLLGAILGAVILTKRRLT